MCYLRDNPLICHVNEVTNFRPQVRPKSNLGSRSSSLRLKFACFRLDSFLLHMPLVSLDF